MVPEIFVFSKKVWDTLPELDQQLIRKASVMAAQKERELWAAREQASLDVLASQGIEVVTDVDKGPFIEATAAVREKFGSEFSDLIQAASEVDG